jgi:nitronate monooxygenase
MIGELLEISLPILQAPMAGAQGSAMAVAVTNAGGLGSLPCAMLSPETLRQEVARIRAGTSGAFNLNFFCHAQPPVDEVRERRWRQRLAPYYAELGIEPAGISAAPTRKPFDEAAADLIEELQAPVVSFHFGLPEPRLLARVKGIGAKILSTATTVDEALWLESRGVDAVIAQGLEAGGHRGMFLTHDLSTQLDTATLVRRIASVVQVPVIAAGGIADAEGVASALEFGAAAVQIGTAYLLCDESTISPAYRAALKSAASGTTALTNLFSGGVARGIVNRLMRELGPLSDLAPAFPLASAALAPLRAKAESQGSGDFSPLWSGQNPRGCRSVGAGELTRRLGEGVWDRP